MYKVEKEKMKKSDVTTVNWANTGVRLVHGTFKSSSIFPESKKERKIVVLAAIIIPVDGLVRTRSAPRLAKMSRRFNSQRTSSHGRRSNTEALFSFSSSQENLGAKRVRSRKKSGAMRQKLIHFLCRVFWKTYHSYV